MRPRTSLIPRSRADARRRPGSRPSPRARRNPPMLDFSRLTTPRRGFLGGLAAAALGVTGVAGRLAAAPPPRRASNNPELEKWLDGLTGTKRQVVDATAPDGFGLIMTYVWLMTQRDTYGLEDAELSAGLV